MTLICFDSCVINASIGPVEYFQCIVIQGVSASPPQRVTMTLTRAKKSAMPARD
jgi:hypothetical protein